MEHPAMSISKRKTKRGEDRFDVLYRGPDGRELSRTFRTRPDARMFEDDQRYAMRKGLWVDPADGRTSLAQWSDEWLSTTIHLAASSMRIHADNMRLHVLPDVVDATGAVRSAGLGGHQLGRLTTTQLTAWLSALTSKPKAAPGAGGTARRSEALSPASVHQAYRTLHVCLEAAVGRGRIGRNPLDGVKPPLIVGGQMRFLQVHEVERLADEVGPTYRALVLVAAYCGLRIGELLALRWENLDLIARTIRVVEQLDADAGHGVTKPPKTFAGRRSVPLPAFVADALRDHDQYAIDGSGRVFTSPAGAPLHLTNFRRRVWGPAIIRAGVAPLRIHDLRHTCASLAIQAGADVKVLQRMLGHASAAVTLDRYGHLLPGQAEAVADRLDTLRASSGCAARGARPRS